MAIVIRALKNTNLVTVPNGIPLTLICIKWAPRDPSTIISVTTLTQKMLRFHVFLHFNSRKHMMSSFYLNWTEFTRDCEFLVI